MGSHPSTVEHPVTSDRRPQAGARPATRSLLARTVGAVSTLLVVSGLGAVAYLGHETGWSFTRHRAATEQPDPFHGTAGLAVVRRAGEAAGATTLPPLLRQPVSIAFPSAEVVDKAGIDIAPVWRGAMTDAVAASGEVSFDPARVARLSARAPGTVWRVTKPVGGRVEAGEVLALVDAADVGKAKAEFLQGLVQVRLRRAAAGNLQSAGAAVPEPRRREAEAAVKEADVRLLGAEQALLNLGLPVRAADFETLSLEAVADRLRLLGVPAGETRDTRTANLLPVHAPLAGVLLSVDVVGGELVDVGKVMFVVVDPSRLWLTLHVGPEDARRVAVGQTVRFRPDGGGEEAEGRVTWVGPTADETTRTVPVRAELANESGNLRASTLGRGRVVIRQEKNALVVPLDAVQRVQGTSVVFVRDKGYLKPGSPKAFHVRAVSVGAADQQNVEVTGGLSDGDVVATKGSRLILAELERFAAGNGAGR